MKWHTHKKRCVCVLTDNKDGTSSPTSPHPGNGVMAQPKKIKGIGFGDIFREGSVKLRTSQKGPSENMEKTEKVSVVLCLTMLLFAYPFLYTAAPVSISVLSRINFTCNIRKHCILIITVKKWVRMWNLEQLAQGNFLNNFVLIG